MRNPKDRGRPIDNFRVNQWVVRFAGYRLEATANRIKHWIEQFTAGDRDVAARVLDCLCFVSNHSVNEAFKNILGKLDGWDSDAENRKGKWRFVAFSTAAGESGDTMLHKWRVATRMAGTIYNKLYIYRSDLPKENLGPKDTVVFIDDFAGTGTQVCTGWREVMGELLPGDPKVYLILVAVTKVARQKISNETPMQVVSRIKLKNDDNIFSADCRHFTAQEKTTLLTYCRRANKRDPRGWGDCGLVIVLADNTPNNSIPILHANRKHWVALFPRQ